MPSHLDEDDKLVARTKALKDGLVTLEDLQGNSAVDLLAKAGAKQHKAVGHLHAAACDRKTIAVLVQKMQAHIWELYIEKAAPESWLADLSDTSPVAHQQPDVYVEDDDQYDYDPFVDVGACTSKSNVQQGSDGSLSASAQVNINNGAVDAGATNLNAMQKYPNFGWRLSCGGQDECLTIRPPARRTISQMATNGR